MRLEVFRVLPLVAYNPFVIKLTAYARELKTNFDEYNPVGIKYTSFFVIRGDKISSYLIIEGISSVNEVFGEAPNGRIFILVHAFIDDE